MRARLDSYSIQYTIEHYPQSKLPPCCQNGHFYFYTIRMQSIQRCVEGQFVKKRTHYYQMKFVTPSYMLIPGLFLYPTENSYSPCQILIFNFDQYKPSAISSKFSTTLAYNTITSKNWHELSFVFQ